MLRILVGVAALAAVAGTAQARGPYYGGGHHTYSHGGHYVGGYGRSHRGGHYVSRTGSHHYGHHR